MQLSARNLDPSLRDAAYPASCSTPSTSCAPWTTSAWTCRRVASPPSSARAVRVSPSSRACWRASCAHLRRTVPRRPGDQSRQARTLAYTSQVQLVLQDPFASNNPVHRVRHSLERPLLIHGAKKQDVEELAKAALERVSLDPPDALPRSLPARALRRTAPARLHRSRPLRAAQRPAR